MLHKGTGRPAASKGQESWKLRKAAPGWAVMERMLWARKCTEGAGKPKYKDQYKIDRCLFI